LTTIPAVWMTYPCGAVLVRVVAFG
jgi:hypothetical protein